MPLVKRTRFSNSVIVFPALAISLATAILAIAPSYTYRPCFTRLAM
jgi:hypothetical protein